VVSENLGLDGEPRGVKWMLGNGHVHMGPTDTHLHELLPHIKRWIRVPSGAQHAPQDGGEALLVQAR
jgi:hypothetical protein